MKKESIIYGTIFLIITNFLVKTMSLIYRGITIRMIGAEGLGLMEMLMPIYSLLIVISSLGIPPAISNMISAEQSQSKINAIIKTGTIVLLISSTLTVLFTYLIFPFFNDIIFSDKRILPAFYVLAPSIILISVFSSLRSFFQGVRRTSLIGKSQLIEQTIRLVCGISIITFLLKNNASIGLILMGLAAATFLAEFGGGFYLLIKYKAEKSNAQTSFKKPLISTMLHYGAPITLSRIVLTATTALQALIVPYMLISVGANQSEAAAFYGLFAGVALTILHLPSIITGALITPLIPAIAEANSINNNALRNLRIEKSIIFTNITALPILAILFYFAEDICNVLFASPEAGSILSILCIGGIFLYLQHPLIGILQGMNKFHQIFIHYFIGNTLYIASLYFLHLSNHFSLLLFLIIYILDDILIFVMNYIYLKKITGFKINKTKAYIVPCIALITGFTVMVFFEKNIMQTATTSIMSMMLSACLFMICYLIVLFFSGVLNKRTISSLLSSHRHR